MALERGQPGEHYILGGENWTQKKLVERAAFHMKVKTPTRKIGMGLLLTLAGLSETWARLSGKPPLLTRGVVRLYDCKW